jgi:hypothetical protein
MNVGVPRTPSAAACPRAASIARVTEALSRDANTRAVSAPAAVTTSRSSASSIQAFSPGVVKCLRARTRACVTKKRSVPLGRYRLGEGPTPGERRER